MSLLDPGTYTAHTSGPIVVYETEGGALCAAVPCEVTEGDKAGTKIKHTMTIVKKDGTVQTRTVGTLKEVFGWDGLDPFWLMDTDLQDKQFEIVTNDETGTDGKTYSKVEWLNVIGGGPGMKMPQPADRRTVLAKYGSQFRALAGGAPVKPAVTTPPPPLKKTAPPAPPSKTEPVSTMDEAWKTLWDNNPGIENDAATAQWTAAIGKLGKPIEQLTPQDWGKLKAEFADNVPM